MKENLFPKGFGGRRVAILGFGRAGRAAARFFLAHGAHVSVYTRELMPGDALAPWQKKGVLFSEGAFPDRFPEELVVRSPVIRPDILPLVGREGSVTDESELFLALTPARVIGVTGSDGKTTTSALIAAILRAAGENVFLGGNNGTPLLPQVDDMTERDFAVIELSSFQLMGATHAPDIAVVTNITPNHLDWHKDFDEYVAAKRRILQGASRLVLNTRTLDLVGFEESFPPTAFFSAEKVAPPMRECDAFVFVRGECLVVRNAEGESEIPVFKNFRLPGKHNRENLAAAVAALWGLVPDEAILAVAADFCGVPHRLQYVDTVGGVTYYNSSIDTSPTRTAAALSALGGRPLVIVGGRGKGISLAPLADALARRARGVYAYGDTREEIAQLLCGRVPTETHAAFADVFAAATRAAREGDTVLLSPGCTAFGEFRDFEERGEVFCRMVRELAERKERS